MPTPIAKIEITLMDTGGIMVAGVVEPRYIALGMLEFAKHTINKLNDKTAEEKGGMQAASLGVSGIITLPPGTTLKTPGGG